MASIKNRNYLDYVMLSKSLQKTKIHCFLTKMDILSYSGASTSQAANSSDREDSRPDSSDPESSRPALALHLQTKHVASEVNATLLKPPKESTP